MKKFDTRFGSIPHTVGLGAVLLTMNLVAGCHKAPVTRTFENFCDAALDEQRVQVDGYLAISNITICGEDSWGRNSCPLLFTDRADGFSLGTDHTLWIYLGDEPNRMYMPHSTERDKLVVHGNDGKQLDALRPVRVIGELSGPSELSGDCSIDVETIEQSDATDLKGSEPATVDCGLVGETIVQVDGVGAPACKSE
jgi:hypothetical protein